MPRAFHRVFGWSDLHVDYGANFDLVARLSQQDFRHDLLLLAGDVSSNPARLIQTLALLKARFAEVAFVPGNHDLWVSVHGSKDSLGRLDELRAQCQDLGIRMGPFTGTLNRRQVRIIPLLSWYLKPEEGEGSLFLPKPGEDPQLAMWADNHRIKWPPLPDGRTPAEHLLVLNSPPSSVTPESPTNRHLTITFSHFLPRVELVFNDWNRYLTGGAVSGNDRTPRFNFTRVAGCRQLDDLLRQHRSTIHLYGHQHRNRDRLISGVRYVSHCLGYPAERTGEPTQPDRLLPLELA